MMNNRRPCELLLIDGDTLVYRYGLMNHEAVDFEDTPPLPPLEHAKAAIREKLQFLLDDTGVPDFRIALAPPGVKCFRYGFYPAYKAHRDTPPDIIRELKQWMRVEYHKKLISHPTSQLVETDDILGYHHKADGSTCIVSNDKDFLTLPGWLYHPFTGDLHWITHPSAMLQKFYQVLVGDSADGFPGCPGIGPKKAEEILLTALEIPTQSPHRLWDVVHFTYLSQGATLDDFITNWCLLNVSGIIITPEIFRHTCYTSHSELPEAYHETLDAVRSQQ
jgi:DNA polymerase I